MEKKLTGSKPKKEEASRKEKVEEKPVEPVEPIEVQEERKTVFEVIPGKFIVKCPEGYYVDEDKFSKSKSAAMVFYDFNLALRKKRRYGGKVVKL